VSTLTDLARSERGTALLREEGVLFDPRSFVESLQPPASKALARPDSGATDDRRPSIVYMGQQLCVDYGASVVAKLAALSELHTDPGLQGVAIWVDTDRAGSEPRMTSISWPRAGGREGVSLAPPGSKRREPRFIEIDHSRLARAWDRLRTYLGESEADPSALERYTRLREFVSGERCRTLADLSSRITEFVLSERGIRLRHVRLSTLLEQPDLIEAVEATLNALPRVIEVFNRAVWDLRAAGIDPLLHPLPDDYLPLRFACEADRTRLPLRRSDGPGGSYAVATCRCGAAYRLSLGRDELSLEEIVQTGSWSPDVLLPVFLNDLAGGVVGGRSSAVYCMVLNRVLREALGKEPIPMLVPVSLASANGAGTRPAAESLVVSYLLAG
jgi:hypothetical protein